MFNQQACDVKQFQPADVNTSNSQIGIASHGFTELQPLQFVKQYGSLSSFPATGSCQYGAGMIEGQSYYAHPIDSNHFRVYCPDRATLTTLPARAVRQHTSALPASRERGCIGLSLKVFRPLTAITFHRSICASHRLGIRRWLVSWIR